MPDRRATSREQRHQRILTAAEQLFATQGFAKTSVDEITAAARVSKGLLYQHYASKEDLLVAVWMRLVAGWAAATQQAKFATGSVADAIGEAMRLSFEHVNATPLLRRILAQDPGTLTPGGTAGIAAFARGYRTHLEPVIARGIREGELRADIDVAHTAELIWLLHFTLTRELHVGPHANVRADADALVRATVALVVAGLREPAERTAKRKPR